MVQLLNLTSNNHELLGGIEEVSIISHPNKNAMQWLISDQDNEGELVGAKALWLAVITKVTVIVLRYNNGIVIGDIQRGRNTKDDQNKESADAREVALQKCPKFQFTMLVQVVARVIGRTFTGGVTVVVSFNQFVNHLT